MAADITPEQDKELRKLFASTDLQEFEYNPHTYDYVESQALMELYGEADKIYQVDFINSAVELQLKDQDYFVMPQAETNFGLLCKLYDGSGNYKRVVLAGSLFISEKAFSNTQVLPYILDSIFQKYEPSHEQRAEILKTPFAFLPNGFVKGGHVVTRDVFDLDEITEESRRYQSASSTGKPVFMTYLSECDEVLAIDANPRLHFAQTQWAQVSDGTFQFGIRQ